MFFYRLMGTAGLVAFLALPANGQNTLYFDDFGGSAGVPLHGLAPDVDNNGGGNTWVTRTDTEDPSGTGVNFMADGSILGGTQGGATLAFTPTPGFVYTLSASFGAVTATNGENWVALGFGGGQSSTAGGGRFIAAPTTGQPWMIYRSTTATLPDTVFLGPGTANPTDWPVPITSSRGAPVDMKIVLDTTQAAWTAEWFAKNSGDANFTSIHSASYAENPTIGGVGIALANTDVISSITSFRLETSGSVFLPGDVNGDGEVDILDFNVISDNLFNTGATHAQGDLNGDGVVNFADFRVWKQIFEAGGGNAEGLVVPEPASWILGILGFLCVAYGWRRGRR